MCISRPLDARMAALSGRSRGIEAYFEEKQRELEAPEQDAPAPEVLPDVPETAEPEEQPSADSALGVYDLDRSDVSEMASDLQKAHIHRSREEGKPFMDERYERLLEAGNHPDEQLAKLREDVDTARCEFHASKEALDTLQSPCPGLLAGMHVFAKAGRNAKDPVSRMMADMTAMMLRMMIQQALAEERRRQREEAEKRVYESRKNMWDAEKRLKAAEKALSNEDERESKARAKTVRARYARARSVSPSTPRSADKGHAVRRVAEKMREQRQASPFFKSPLAGYEETFRRAVDGRTCKGRKTGVFVVRSFMSRIRKTRGTDGAKRGREARLETSKSPDKDPKVAVEHAFVDSYN